MGKRTESERKKKKRRRGGGGREKKGREEGDSQDKGGDITLKLLSKMISSFIISFIRQQCLPHIHYIIH